MRSLWLLVGLGRRLSQRAKLSVLAVQEYLLFCARTLRALATPPRYPNETLAQMDSLGVGSLTTGKYTQVRLVVSEAKLFFDNPSVGDACAAAIAAPAGASAMVEIPSGEVKLNRGFDVAEAGATMMLLDFDGDRSIRETGNGRYIMSPVIAVVSVQ